MARAGVTKFQIYQAANALVAAGDENPSNEDVRARLGSGSMSTIAPIMKEWRDAHERGAGAGDGLPDPVLIAVLHVHQALLADAQRYVDDGWQQIEAREAEAESAIAAAAQQQRETAAVVQTLREQLAAAQGVRAELEVQLRAEASARARAETQRDEQLQTAERLARELAELRPANTVLERELRQSKAALDESRRDCEATNELVRELRSSLDQALASAERDRHAAHVSAARVVELVQACEGLKADLESSARREATLRSDLDAERHRRTDIVQQLERELQTAKADHTALKEALTVAESDGRSLAVAQQTIAQLQQQLSAVREDYRALQAEMANQLRELVSMARGKESS